MRFFSTEHFKHLRWLYITSLLLLSALGITYLADRYFESKISRDWESISAAKTEMIRNETLSLFSFYQNSTLEFSSGILSNRKLSSALINQNIKKSYESFTELEQIKEYNLEVYNSRLEPFLFYGKQLNPDIVELTRASSGQTFSAVKEIGFYTYLLVYRPIQPDSSVVKPASGTYADPSVFGVLVIAKLIDVDYPLKNKFFKNSGLTNDIFKKTGTTVDFSFKQSYSSQLLPDSNLLKENSVFELRGINGDVLGAVYVPKPEKSSYVQEVHNKFSILISAELFLLSLTVLIIFFTLINKTGQGTPAGRYIFQKIVLAGILLTASRYFWLLIEFPQKLFTYIDVDIFSPSFYASTVAFGIAKSIGELLITAVTVLIFCFYLISRVVEYCKKDIKPGTKILSILMPLSGLFIIFFALQAYGYVIQSLVFDSNLKYFDRSQIISTGQFELLLIQFVVLLISISLVIVILSSGLIISKFTAKIYPNIRFIKKNSVLIAFAVIILLNILADYTLGNYVFFSLKLGLRALILILSALFVYYFQRQLAVTRKYSYVTLLNISLTLLISVIFIPVVLLNKITSQENKFIELSARKLSEQVNDKVTFMLSSNLEDLSDNPAIENEILNKNKYPKLAFSIWSESKLSSENLNSAVFVLDTAKRLISDFNTNPAELQPDSVVKFALSKLSNFKWREYENNIDEEVESTQEEAVQEGREESSEADMEGIAENKEMRYYCGIVPVEKTDLKNSMFRRIVGYVIMAVQYDSRSYLTQSGTELFVNFTSDNLENKLMSTPVISEFTNGELVSSSDREVSKSFLKSIDAFTESVRDKADKSAWRYDEFEKNIYKSFYTLTGRNISGNKTEKIFIVSSRVNDFSTMTFFAFKYLLFVVIVYIIFLLVYILYKSFQYLKLPKKNRHFTFGYREKLFAAFFIVSVIPIVILALYTREFVENKNAEFYNEQLISDLKLVNQYIKNKIPPADRFKKTVSPPDYLTNLSNIFGGGFPESHKNFNLFVKTKLVSTTNEELYKSDLLDTRISASAYYNVVLLKKDYFVETQEIGNFRFIVGYKPVYDNFNNLLGIISSQTFFKQYEINEELTESLIYILGTYIVAVIFLIFIVNILSYRISNPVIKLLRATEQLSKGNVEIQVKSRSKDEIGELVRSFNKMIRELKRSREELKKAERESAWRDIARQVAHEIKNPLTPIKLAMQHLYHAYSRKTKDFKEVLQTTHKLIIDQIESLNRIATEFSDFAKMPSRNYEPVKMDNVVTDVVSLFSSENKVQIKTDFSNGSVKVLGDRDEIKRALINIIRNSLQAIEQKSEDNFKGAVSIDSYTYNGYYCLRIKDNGIGMDDETMQKLFEPYFSTKSKGMGLGLMITKKIIDEMKGRIYIKSEPNLGTEVEVRFKILNDKRHGNYSESME